MDYKEAMSETINNKAKWTALMGSHGLAEWSDSSALSLLPPGMCPPQTFHSVQTGELLPESLHLLIHCRSCRTQPTAKLPAQHRSTLLASLVWSIHSFSLSLDRVVAPPSLMPLEEDAAQWSSAANGAVQQMLSQKPAGIAAAPQASVH